MTQLGECLGTIAPYFNLFLVAIVIALLIFFLRRPNKKIYLKPWKLVLVAILIFVVEEILTVFNDLGIINISKLVAPLLEMVIIGLFIYLILLQRDYLKSLK